MRATPGPMPPGRLECVECGDLFAVGDLLHVCAPCLDGFRGDAATVAELERREHQRAAGRDRLVPATEVARRLGLTPRHVRRLIGAGRLRGIVRGGTRYYAFESAIRAFLTAGRPGAA